MEILLEHLLRGVRLVDYMESGGVNVAGVSISMPTGPHRRHYALPHLLKAREDIARMRGKEGSAAEDEGHG